MVYAVNPKFFQTMFGKWQCVIRKKFEETSKNLNCPSVTNSFFSSGNSTQSTRQYRFVDDIFIFKRCE
jgi:hypothetical protein